MRDKIVDVMPEMKTGKELLDCLRETPEYPACIWEKSSMERLVALSASSSTKSRLLRVAS